MTDSENHLFQLAYDLVCNTGQHVFLTGRAGTGKTTFLKYLVEHSDKRLVVVAPTGVAAINAGGVTMHSQFNLPIEPTHYLMESPGNQIFNSKSLFQNVRMSNQKIGVLKELELLVIDEVSMVRADVLDLVDLVLRRIRKNYHDPFGGVQVLMIGDLYQLSPVIKPDEWEKLRTHYSGHFFFHSKVVQEARPIQIELNKIYRQKDQIFVDLLNKVRSGKLQTADLHLLNSRLDPDFEGPEKGYITLCTHNRMADSINQSQLEKLKSPLFQFSGEIKGEFNEKALPAEETLELKIGARVMFIRNDSSDEKRYYNGKQGVISDLEEDEIWVTCGDESFQIEMETWENVQFSFDKEQDKIIEEKIGSYSQYPLRLAWAITIHKSQGLTFEKAVIDAGQSFSSGQVYVALSRCTSLEGLVLKSAIPSSVVFSAQEVVAFSSQTHKEEFVQTVLNSEKAPYQAKRMVRAFSMEPIVAHLNLLDELIREKRIPHPEVLLAGMKKMNEKAVELGGVCENARNHFLKLINHPEAGPDSAQFRDKVRDGIIYFSNRFDQDFMDTIQVILKDLKAQKGVKGLVASIIDFRKTVEAQKNRIQRVKLGEVLFYTPPINKKPTSNPSIEEPIEGFKKAEKGETYKITLELFEEGKSIAEIAKIRGMALGTIEGHLSRHIASGKIDVTSVVAAEKIEAIQSLLEKQADEITGNPVKAALGDFVSWGEIRCVISDWNRRKG